MGTSTTFQDSVRALGIGMAYLAFIDSADNQLTVIKASSNQQLAFVLSEQSLLDLSGPAGKELLVRASSGRIKCDQEFFDALFKALSIVLPLGGVSNWYRNKDGVVSIPSAELVGQQILATNYAIESTMAAYNCFSVIRSLLQSTPDSKCLISDDQVTMVEAALWHRSSCVVSMAGELLAAIANPRALKSLESAADREKRGLLAHSLAESQALHAALFELRRKLGSEGIVSVASTLANRPVICTPNAVGRARV